MRTGAHCFLGILLGAAALLTGQEPSKGQIRLTGCLDERTGPQYVIRSEGELRMLAEISASGNAAEQFAKYLGHRVEVTGTVVSRDSTRDVPQIRVTRIRDLSPTCAPKSEQ